MVRNSTGRRARGWARDATTPSAPADPPAAAVARFAEDYARTTRHLSGAPLIVGVSGGPDSLALTLLAHAALGSRVSAITVDHGLRAEAKDEARHVAEICSRRGIAHRIETPPPLDPTLGNLQARARDLRYAVFDDVATQAGGLIATAHHADDQLETVLMRLNRGSGVAGLAGIRARTGALVRPLLGWRRAELAAVVAACGETAVDDPSNRDDRFDRARLRKHLADAPWLDPLAATRSAAALAEAEDALGWAASRARDALVSCDDTRVAFRQPSSLPAELRRRVAVHCLTQVQPTALPRGAAIDRMLVALTAGRTVTLAGVICIGSLQQWVFGPAPDRRSVNDAIA